MWQARAWNGITECALRRLVGLAPIAAAEHDQRGGRIRGSGPAAVNVVDMFCSAIGEKLPGFGLTSVARSWAADAGPAVCSPLVKHALPCSELLCATVNHGVEEAVERPDNHPAGVDSRLGRCGTGSHRGCHH